MTSEQTVSEAQIPQARLPLGDPQGHDEQTSQGPHEGQDGQNIPHGMGQSKSSRRRRRKRKNKGADASSAEGSPMESTAGDTLPALQAAPPPTAAHQNGAHQNGAHSNQNGASGSTAKRWKKKFRDRDRQRTPENPGNIAAGAAPQQNNGGSNGFRDANSHQPGNGGGFKRKGGSSGGGRQQQRGPRSFVGPMDHSYRVANGNFADTPPSTIEPHGNFGGRAARLTYQSDSQPIDYSQGRVVPIAVDAPTKIYFFIDDLFFIAKIQETARKLGVKVAFIKNDKESIAALTSHEDDDRPGLIVFDLNNAND